MKHLHVSGRRWFTRNSGNTYHTARTLMDGESGPAVPFSYGYGDHYLTTAAEALEGGGHVPGREHHANGSAEPLWRYCERNGIKFTYEVNDVSRRSDLGG